MSGPVQPPLTVTTVGGTPTGRPITTIKVSDGDLTISGNVATIDTSGSGGLPGGSNNEIQFNDSGAFGGDAGFLMNVKGDGGTTKIQVGNILMGANLGVGTAATNGTVYIQSDGTGQIFLTSGSDSGGTFADTIVNVNCNAGSDNSILRFRDNSATKEANIKLDGSSNLDIDNENTDKNIELSVKGTGSVELKNATTNNASTLIVRGNGTGTPTINLTNDTKAVTLKCDESQKLKVAGGSSNFIFDASSGTGGITWPDGTTQITASSGGGGGSGLGVVMSPTNASLASADTYLIGRQSPYAIWADFEVSNNQNTSNNPRYFPFIAPTAGSISEMSIRVGTSQSGTNLLVGIYEDSSGVPGTQVATASIPVSITGYVTVTSFSGTNSLDANSQYWFGHVADTARTTLQLYQLLDSQILPTLPAASLSDKPSYAWYSSDSNSLPAAPTLAGATDSGRLFASIKIT